MRIAVVGTLDTKGAEYRLLIDALRRRGAEALLVDVGVFDSELGATADVPAAEVAAAAATSLEALRAGGRGSAMQALAEGLAVVLGRLHAEGRIDGVAALGGGGGSHIVGEGMRALPLGFPKVLVSTFDGESLAGLVAGQDLALIASPVDIAGRNPILGRLVENAAAAVVAMAQASAQESAAPLVAVTMMGITDAGVSAARRIVEEAGLETVTFTSNGSGALMERLVREGRVAAALDLTTAELAADLLDGPFTAGPGRLSAAAEAGIPLVVAPGGIDVVGFRERSSVPERLAGRQIVEHNPRVTLVRTSAEDNAAIGRLTAAALNRHPGRPVLIVPTRGFSGLSVEGAPFFSPEAVEAYLEAARSALADPSRLLVLDAAVTDAAFAAAAAAALLEQLRPQGPPATAFGR